MSVALSNVIEELLKGKFICPITERSLYKVLREDGNERKVKQALELMNRSIHQTSRSGAFYAVYNELDADKRQKVKGVMSSIHTSIRPVVGFLSLITEASQVDTVLSAGDELSLPTIVSHIQGSPALEDKLDKVYRFPKVKRKKNCDSNSDKLHVVTEYLVKEGLIRLASKEREIYVVTGKIDFIYEMLEYIDSHERVVEQINTQKIEQGELSFE